MDLNELKVLPPYPFYLKIYAEYFQHRAEHPIFYLKNNCPFKSIFFPEHLRGITDKRIINGPDGIKMYPPLHQCIRRRFLIMPAAERRLYLVHQETCEEMETVLEAILTAWGMRIAEEPRLYRMLLAHFAYNCNGAKTSIFELVAALERMLWQSELNLIRDYRLLTRDSALYEKIFFAIEKAKKTGGVDVRLLCART